MSIVCDDNLQNVLSIYVAPLDLFSRVESVILR